MKRVIYSAAHRPTANHPEIYLLHWPDRLQRFEARNNSILSSHTLLEQLDTERGLQPAALPTRPACDWDDNSKNPGGIGLKCRLRLASRNYAGIGRKCFVSAALQDFPKPLNRLGTVGIAGVHG